MGQNLTIRYKAILNENAVVNSTAGNPNDIELEFTNNPNIADNHNKLNDKVISYTYEFKIRKVDKTTAADLAGAAFSIKDSSSATIASYTYDTHGTPQITYTKPGNDHIKIAVNGAYVTVTGVDAGKYYIEETAPPSGYSLINGDIEVTITAIKDQLTQLPTGNATIAVNGSSEIAEIRLNEDSTLNSSDGSIDIIVTIKDTKGISLPTTGSFEASILLCGGIGALTIACLAFLIAAFVRRKNRLNYKH